MSGDEHTKRRAARTKWPPRDAGSRLDLSQMWGTDNLNRWYDAVFANKNAAAMWEGSGYLNFGLWDRQTESLEAACVNLVDRLIADLDLTEGVILDAGCGVGTATARVAEVLGPANQVHGINISEAQVEQARARAPACRFEVMDAAQISFDDEAFDLVVSVESAYHFDTREDFLRGAFRTLRPGGRLRMSDVLLRMGPLNVSYPPQNRQLDMAGYDVLLRDVGFTDVLVEDHLDLTWRPFRRFVLRYLRSLVKKIAASPFRGGLRGADLGTLVFLLEMVLVWNLVFKNYVLVSARKPGAASPRYR